MTPSLTNELAWLLIFLQVLDVALMIGVWRLGKGREWIEEWPYYYRLVCGVLCFFIAVGLLIQGLHVISGFYTAASVIHFYRWWHDDRNKRKRKKLVDRMAGVVREIGGRLKVVNPVAIS